MPTANLKTGIKREKPYRVGKGKPPKETQFGVGNQASVGHGRPRGNLTEKIRALLETPSTNGGTKGDNLARVAEKQAAKGDFRFFKEIIDRVDGKIPDPPKDEEKDELIIRIVREIVKSNAKDD